ncbi:DtxR family transcriptional regulator [Halanaerobium salsuginis]|uniref:Iron (Metal) dependent repressor, DtxR family n=1 Tax=Halanaerobium salsuginis TaxID=29563 RepID=A0A1I4L8A4_9FIRM|nr:DtxR family transcriptional regulator [Halanaerobium salsuginis]SFL87190.1 iron (metal) dependent repressor, DtxR family [Halanaerobium salsuginis]
MGETFVLSESMEDYLETILNLIKQNGSARVTDIARTMEVAASSVNESINRLSARGLVEQEKYGPIKLTAAGREWAERIDCTHQIIYLFLEKILGIDPETADRDACAIEHDLSQKSFKAMVDFLLANGHLTEQSCALAILAKKEEADGMAAKEVMLNDLAVGSTVEVVKLTSKGALKRKLMDMGLNRGAKIEVKGKAPMGDPIEVKVRGYSLSLRKKEAEEIMVREV